MKISKTFLCTISILPFFAGASIAADADVEQNMVETVAYLFGSAEIFGGDIKLVEGNGLVGNANNEPFDAKFRGGSARVGYGFGNGLFVLGEVFGERTNTGDASDSYASSRLYAGHLGYQIDNWLIAGFAGKLTTDQDNNATQTSIRSFYGAQAQYAWNDVVLMAQGGRLVGTGGNDASGLDSIRDANFYKVGVKWFITPDTVLGAHYSAIKGIMDTDAHNVEVDNWGIMAEHQFSLDNNVNFSAFAKYSVSSYDERPTENDYFDEQTWMVGLKIKFGAGGTLKSQTIRGQELQAPHELVRWVAQTGGPSE